MSSIAEYIDNEWFVVRHSGEMPEVAYHSALYYLSKAEDGPKFSLGPDQRRQLCGAAEERFREIVLRDLQPENRGTTIYRGVKRSMVNYRRYLRFCHREGLEIAGFSGEVAAALLLFLVSEAVASAKGMRQSVINCSFQELNHFAVEIGLVTTMLPPEIAWLCDHDC